MTAATPAPMAPPPALRNCVAWNKAARLRALKQGRRRDARRFERNIKSLEAALNA
jgi:hypothetical protein